MKALWGSELLLSVSLWKHWTIKIALTVFPSLARASEMTAACTDHVFTSHISGVLSPNCSFTLFCLPQLLNTSCFPRSYYMFNTTYTSTCSSLWMPQFYFLFKHASMCTVLTLQTYLFTESQPNTCFTAPGPKIMVLLWVEIGFLWRLLLLCACNPGFACGLLL